MDPAALQLQLAEATRIRQPAEGTLGTAVWGDAADNERGQTGARAGAGLEDERLRAALTLSGRGVTRVCPDVPRKVIEMAVSTYGDEPHRHQGAPTLAVRALGDCAVRIPIPLGLPVSHPPARAVSAEQPPREPQVWNAGFVRRAEHRLSCGWTAEVCDAEVCLEALEAQMVRSAFPQAGVTGNETLAENIDDRPYPEWGERLRQPD